MKNYLEYHTTEADSGAEVLAILKNYFHFSSRKIKSVKFAEEGILLDGVRVNVRKKLLPGQILAVLLDDSDKIKRKVSGIQLPIRILYEDEFYLIADKPSGVVSHPSPGHYFDSLTNAARWYLDQKGDSSVLHVCGRLDKDTSGVLVFAKNSAAEYELLKQKKEGIFQKSYLAVAEGNVFPEEDSIEIPMIETRTPSGLLKMQRADVCNEKTKAYTEYKVQMKGAGYSILEVQIQTGRTHQIRFHMSAIGHPLLGDPLYGSCRSFAKSIDGKTPAEANDRSMALIHRTALHAYRLRFWHPYAEKEMLVTAPIPADMQKLLKNAGETLRSKIDYI